MKAYFAYIRVSTTKQGQFGSSLQEQRDAILTFARRHDLQISEWFEDRETAAKKGRTQFVKMMVALEKGQALGVILHKIDRGARNLWDWARLQDLIDTGVKVHFVHDNLDLQSRGGRLAADIQAVVAADYVRNLRDEVRKGVRGRYKQGLFPRKAPVGYLDMGKATPKAIDPVKGPVIRAIFELYATGQYSYDTLAEELKRRGLTRSTGKPYGPNNLTAILGNSFYMGLIHIRSTGETYQGVHEPLITARLFKAVQDVREGKHNRKTQHHDFVFRRLLVCGLCTTTLIGEVQKGIVYYRCHVPGCATKSVREDTVVSCLRGLAGAVEFSQEDLDDLLPYFINDNEAASAEARKVKEAARLRIAALEDRQCRLTDAYIDGAVDRATFEARKATLLMELATAREMLKDAEHPLGDDRAGLAQQFLELRNMLWLGSIEEDRDQYRDAVQKLTSNRSLFGKRLEISLRSPFRELVSEPDLLLGAPHRETPRTSTGSHPKRVKQSVRRPVNVWRMSPRKRARRISKLLKQWREEVGAEIVREPPPRKRNPSWFTRKETPLLGP